MLAVRLPGRQPASPPPRPRSLLATMAARGGQQWCSAWCPHSLVRYLRTLTRTERVSALPWRRGWRHQITGARWRHFAVFIESALCDVSGGWVQVAVATDLAARCRPAQSVAGLHQVLTASAGRAARPRRKTTSWRYGEGHARSLNFNRRLATFYLLWITCVLFIWRSVTSHVDAVSKYVD